MEHINDNKTVKPLKIVSNLSDLNTWGVQKLHTSIKLLDLSLLLCPEASSLPFKNIGLLPRFFKKKEPSPSIFMSAW